jgi:hypothetical protein
MEQGHQTDGNNTKEQFLYFNFPTLSSIRFLIMHFFFKVAKNRTDGLFRITGSQSLFQIGPLGLFGIARRFFYSQLLLQVRETRSRPEAL